VALPHSYEQGAEENLDELNYALDVQARDQEERQRRELFFHHLSYVER
jgi:hypothetical protein